MNEEMRRNEKRPENSSEMVSYLKSLLYDLFKQYDVDFSYLGGSWANDTNNWWSDIDIFISLPNFYTLDSKNKLNLLTQLYVKATEMTNFEEIEISIIETLPLHVQFNVISKGVVLYEKNTQIRLNFIERLLPRYYDHKVWFERMIENSKYIE